MLRKRVHPIRHSQRIAILARRQTRRATGVVRDFPCEDGLAVFVAVDDLGCVPSEFGYYERVGVEFGVVPGLAEFTDVGVGATCVRGGVRRCGISENEMCVGYTHSDEP